MDSGSWSQQASTITGEPSQVALILHVRFEALPLRWPACQSHSQLVPSTQTRPVNSPQLPARLPPYHRGDANYSRACMGSCMLACRSVLTLSALGLAGRITGSSTLDTGPTGPGCQGAEVWTFAQGHYATFAHTYGVLCQACWLAGAWVAVDAASQRSLHAHNAALYCRLWTHHCPTVLGRHNGTPRDQRLCQRCVLHAAHDDRNFA